jgi:hypothetical protein
MRKSKEHALGLVRTDWKLEGLELARQRRFAIAWLKKRLCEQNLKPVSGTIRTKQIQVQPPGFGPYLFGAEAWRVYAYCRAVKS